MVDYVNFVIGEVYVGLFFWMVYNYDMNKVSDEIVLVCIDFFCIDQFFCEEFDINIIVERFGIIGQLFEDVRVLQSGDFIVVMDFQSVMNVVCVVEEVFMEMLVNVCVEFGNDFGCFVDFVNNDKNWVCVVEFGIVVLCEIFKFFEFMFVKVVFDVVVVLFVLVLFVVKLFIS